MLRPGSAAASRCAGQDRFRVAGGHGNHDGAARKRGMPCKGRAHDQTPYPLKEATPVTDMATPPVSAPVEEPTPAAVLKITLLADQSPGTAKRESSRATGRTSRRLKRIPQRDP